MDKIGTCTWNCKLYKTETIAEKVWRVLSFDSPDVTIIVRFVAFIFYAALVFPWLTDAAIAIKNLYCCKNLPPLPAKIAGIDNHQLRAKILEKKNLFRDISNNLDPSAPQETLWIGSGYGDVSQFHVFGVRCNPTDRVYKEKDPADRDNFMRAFMNYANVEQVEIPFPRSHMRFTYDILSVMQEFTDSPEYKERVSSAGFAMIVNRSATGGNLSISFLMDGRFVQDKNMLEALARRG